MFEIRVLRRVFTFEIFAFQRVGTLEASAEASSELFYIGGIVLWDIWYRGGIVTLWSTKVFVFRIL